MRSGAQTLLVLAAPLNAQILRALGEGPKQQTELRRAVGLPAQTTLRVQLKRLVELGAIERHRRNRFPGVLEYELTAAGRDLLFVAATLEGWLADAPDGPLAVTDAAARAAVKSLAAAWSTTMLRALAAAPLSLTELDDLIGALSYPALERRLAAMRLAGQIESRSTERRGTPYVVSEWTRRAGAPLLAAARWEQRHRSHASPPFARLDAEVAFLLVMPLLRLPRELRGTCRMAMESNGAGERRLAGVNIELRDGRVVACSTQLSTGVEAWALGSSAAWLAAFTDNEVDRLELGGNGALVRSVLTGMHQVLFASVMGAFRYSP